MSAKLSTTEPPMPNPIGPIVLRAIASATTSTTVLVPDCELRPRPISDSGGDLIARLAQQQPARDVEDDAGATEDRRDDERDAHQDGVDAVALADAGRDTRDVSLLRQPQWAGAPEVVKLVREAPCGHAFIVAVRPWSAPSELP